MSGSSNRRCGFYALIGAPNVGKSTLVNRLVGAKVSIVSPKVQTTRTRVLGIAIADQAQVIFIDTPGIFAPKRRLDRAMVASAWGGVSDADGVLLLVDALRGINAEHDGLHADNRAAVRIDAGRLATCRRATREAIGLTFDFDTGQAEPLDDAGRYIAHRG